MNGMKRYAGQEAQQRTRKETIHVGGIVEVIAFDKDKMTVDVHPISKTLQDGKYESQPPILAVPIADTIGDKYIKRPMFKKGDIGLVVYMDHDIDNVLQKGAESDPNTERNHAEDDAVFLGGIRAGKTVIGTFPDGYAIANLDGSIYFVMTEKDIQIKGDIKIEGDIDIKGDIKIKGNIEHTGNVKQTGNRTMNGTETITGKLIVNGIDFDTHRHGEIMQGANVSGVPQ